MHGSNARRSKDEDQQNVVMQEGQDFKIIIMQQHKRVMNGGVMPASNARGSKLRSNST
jgi:hypothetical protein